MDTESRGRSPRTAARRKGTAAVEFAICLPVLITIVLGSIEATNAIFLKQHLTAAAYEAARKATAPGRTSSDATTAATNVLTQFGVSGGTISISPAVGSATAAGTQITVTASAPLSSNCCITAFIVGKAISTVSARVVMDHQ